MKRLLLICLVSFPAFCQQNAVLLPWTPQQFTNTNGTILASGKVCTYLAGTSTGTATFTDATASVQNSIPPNAVLLDSTGRPTSGGIWLTPNKAYKIVTMTAGSDGTCNTGVVVKTQDNVFASNSFGTNIYVVDGIRFAQSAAGINAADAALGANTSGEIWIPSPGVTATDAQISIGTNHTLRVLGRLTIDSVNRGPILMGKYARLTCLGTGTGGGLTGQGNIVNSGAGTMTAMVQAAVRDGSLETFYVDTCTISGGNQAVSNGLIDITGMNDKGWVRDNIISNFSSGWAIFAQDVQSGAMGGTSNLVISGNWLNPGTGTGGCLEITHSATNAVILQAFDLQNNECQLSGSTIATAPIIIQNLSAGTGNVRTLSMNTMFIQGVPAGQPSININGIDTATFKNIWCGGASTTCINIANSGVNQGLTFENVRLISGTNSLIDNVNTITRTDPVLTYTFLNSNALTQYSMVHTVPSSFYRMIFPEQAAPSGLAGAGLATLYADSGTHSLLFNLNNTGFLFGFNPNSAVSLGGVGGKFRIDSGGAAGNEFRFLSNADVLTGITAKSIIASAAASGDIGSTTLPFANLWLGTAATNNFKFAPASTTAARVISIPDPGVNTNLALNLTGTSAAFATATTAGTCVQNTTAVTGAATTMAVSVSPVSTPGVGAVWSAFVSSAGNVTINECAVATSAGGTIAFNIRVTP